MIQFNIITIFPDFFKPMMESGVVGKAIQSGLIRVELINPRQYTTDVHQAVDDRPFGGGDGMVMMVGPLVKAFEELERRQELGEVIYLSPQGPVWKDAFARQVAATGSVLQALNKEPRNANGSQSFITLLSGRYAGVDSRLLQTWVDQEVSVGDFVLSGGELPAMIVMDSVARFVPGVLGNQDSPDHESFGEGLLEAPQFTRPREWQGWSVPEALLSGDHKRIEQWRQQMSLIKTGLLRFDLIQAGGFLEDLRNALDWLQEQPESDLKICGIEPENIEQMREKVR